jgi:choice-of-anchor C domain-containing protein
VPVLSPLRVRKPARDSINGSRRRHSRPSVELLEVRALLSNLLVNGDLMPPAVTGVSPNGSTKASGAPLARVGLGGPGGVHAVRLNLKTQQGPTPTGLLADGGFETPKINPQKKARTLRAGDPALAGWRIVSGSVNVQTYWPAAEGTHTLDLNGVSAGTIEQSFATTPGQVYQLAFDYGNNPDARAQTAGATVTVTGAGTLLSQQIAHAGSTPRDMKYTHFSELVLANSATTTLQFASTTAGAYGIVLDAVAVTAEPFKFVNYTLIDLGTLGGFSSAGDAVNDAGQVAGVSLLSDGEARAFLSGPGGGPLTDLGILPGGSSSQGRGVNGSGQVAGTSVPPSGFPNAFLSGSGGGPLTGLGTLGGGGSAGNAVNDSGQVAGIAFGHAFLSSPGGGPLKDLGVLPGASESEGFGVNASGQVTGESGGHAFLSGPDGGPLKDLGVLPGASESEGFGVNASGQVAGESGGHAFLSGSDGGPLQDLGPGSGLAVNESGQVVGYATVAGSSSGATHAFLYSDGLMVDLNSLIAPGSGFTLVQANGISDNGYITGVGIAPDGQMHAFLLIPAPEP